MVRIVSPRDTAAMSAASMISNAGGSGGSVFNALSGMNSNASQALFNALGGNAGQTQSVDTILNKQKTDSAKLALYGNAVEQVGQILAGKANPSTEWHKVVAYAVEQGQPAYLYIDSNGSLQGQFQNEADLSKYNPQQQEALFSVMEQIDIMAQKIKANETNDSWLAKLAGASNDVYQVANFVISPQTSTPNNWEQSSVLMATLGQPQKISLDSKGELQAVDQTFDPALDELPFDVRKRLQTAISGITTTIQNDSATQDWEIQAQQFAASRIPYYLEMDMNQFSVDSTTGRLVQGKIIAKENSGENITPAFLKTAPYPDIGDDTTALKQVAQMIKDKKAYFLDVDGTGQVVAKEVTAQNLFKYNDATSKTISNLGTGAILSLFA